MFLKLKLKFDISEKIRIYFDNVLLKKVSVSVNNPDPIWFYIYMEIKNVLK